MILMKQILKICVILVMTVMTGICSVSAEENIAYGKKYTLSPEPNYLLCKDDGDMEYLTDGERVSQHKYSNLAFGKKYTWSKKPNYPLTECVTDNIKLTDGKYADEKAATLWADKNACVGWAGNDLEIVIVFDLEKVEPIEAIYYSTHVFPRADVFLPTIIVGVSNDGAKFKQAAVWTPTNIAQNEDDNFRYTISIKDLKVVGRYLKVVVANTKGWYVFTDEIEIIRGGFEISSVNMNNFIDMDASTKGIRKILASPIYIERIRNYAQSLKDILKENKFSDVTKTAREFMQEVENISFLDKKGYDTIYARYCAIVGKINKIKFTDNFIIWYKNPWERFQRHETPGSNDLMIKSLNSSMMINEYESLSFMLTNTTGQDAAFTIIIEDLKCGDLVMSKDKIVLREAYFIETRSHYDVADALPVIKDNEIVVPAGQTKQIWLTILTRNVNPGKYIGDIIIKPVNNSSSLKKINLELTVYPIKFPDDVPLNTYNWAYIYSWPVLKGLEKEAIADLFAHYTNTFILPGLYPFPEVDKEGNITKPLNFDMLDRALKDFNGARMIASYNPFADVGTEGKELARFPGAPLKFMSEEWQKAFSSWIRQIVLHKKSRGLTYDQFFLYLFDETVRPEVLEVAQLVKKIDPNILFFQTLPGGDLERFCSYIDIFCLLVADLKQQSEANYRNEIKNLWVYDCDGPGRELSPYSYYRLKPWKAWKYGASGVGFWSYMDWVDSAWDVVGVDYGVFYDARTAPADVPRSEAIIPSKRWEAWREGIEDYTYLYLLNALVIQAKGADLNEAIIKKAENTLSLAVKNVLENQDKPDTVNRWRDALLKEMMNLWSKKDILDGNLLVEVTPSIKIKDF